MTLSEKEEALGKLREKYTFELKIPWNQLVPPERLEKQLIIKIGYIAIRDHNARYYLFETQQDMVRGQIFLQVAIGIDKSTRSK